MNLLPICRNSCRVPKTYFECSGVKSLVREQTRRCLSLFRAVGDFCNLYFTTVCVARHCKFLLFFELKIQITWPDITEF